LAINAGSRITKSSCKNWPEVQVFNWAWSDVFTLEASLMALDSWSNLVWVGSKATPYSTSYVGRSVLITQTIGKTPRAADGTVAILVKRHGDAIALPLSA
jgi:hypothetical protein